MEFCHAVYGEAGDDRHVRHAHLSVHEDCHLLHFILIARIHLADFDEEPAVDLLYDLVDTREKLGEQVDRPFLKSFCHDRMVRIRAGLCRHIPCFLPVQSFLVDEQTHQLRNRNGRMGIIHLDDNFLVELPDVAVFLLIFRDQRLEAGGNEEILLFQPELFSGVVVIVRIEDIHDQLRQVLLLHCFVIVTSVKLIQLEVCNRLCIPYAQRIHHMVAVSDDRHIVRDREYRLIILLDKFILARNRVFLKTDIAAETHFLCVLFPAQLERVAFL